VTIRPPRDVDADALAEIQAAASLAALAHVYPPDRYPFPTDAVRRRWREFTCAGGWVRIAEADGRAAGFVAVEPPWLEALYVRPEAWGSGVAAALHDAALAELAAAGVRRATLWVLEANERARRFYERRGWRPDGSTRVVPFPPHPIDLGYALALPDGGE
jgi:GNAT superfamily N-acetyltransferase